MPITLPEIPDLPACLEKLWRQIPPGQVATYGDLAEALGDRIAARWVGQYAMHHTHGDACPCHRIVRADGSLGNYLTGHTEDQAKRLKSEGLPVSHEAVSLAKHRFSEFQTDRPLVGLRRAQESLADRISLRPPSKAFKLVGGVDVSYAPNGDGVAAFVLVDPASGDVISKTVVRRPVRFPYITSYLSFRELPLLIDLLEECDRQGQKAGVLLVDGSGMLHPRRSGIASHLGVVRGQPTIGVTKKLLCGSVDIDNMKPMQSRPVRMDGEPVGGAIRPTSGSRRPIFFSPGHRMDVATAESIVVGLLRGHRLPEPLYWADRLSREAVLSDKRGDFAPSLPIKPSCRPPGGRLS